MKAGSIQFHDFLMVNNAVAGVEMKLLQATEKYTDNGAKLVNCRIAASPKVGIVEGV